MSIIDEHRKTPDPGNLSFDQNTEEHFEFTPLNEDSFDDDLSFTNGDSSLNSPSTKPFLQRNTILTSSFRKSCPMRRNSNSLIPNSPMNGVGLQNSRVYESDDMINDNNSMEEYIIHLTEKLKKLQDQVQYLKEGQQKNEEKYSSMKKENSTLHNKINYLEEQIRDIELQAEDKRKEGEQRFRESMARIEREKTQELENCVSRICALQKESVEAKEEIKRHQQTIDRLQAAKEQLESDIRDKNDEIQSLKDEIKRLKEIIRLKNEERSALDSSLIEVLNQELSINREVNEVSNHDDDMLNDIHSELEQQLRILKEENRTLKENNEELTAQLLNNHLIEGKSLLKQGEAISSLANEISDLNSEQLKTALKEQQDVNAKLRAYIDGILLNIVENYPQLLEVKSNSSGSTTTSTNGHL